MGKAIIVEDKGLGLYRIKLDYDLTAVNGEIAALEAEETEYYPQLLKALNTLDDQRRAKAEAAEGMNAVIQQWKDLLIDKMNEEPPAIPPPVPNDPETGLPWTDEDRAQDGPLFEAINTERTAASVATLSRDSALDTVILLHLRSVALSGSTLHRAVVYGYNYDQTVGVGQVRALGTRTPADAVAQWMRHSEDRALILSEDYTECGVAYVYAPWNPYTYLWGSVLATPGPPPTTETAETDPAQEAAEEADATLEKIELPTIETFEPDKLGAVAAEYAKAALRVTAAERAVQELQAERINRKQRLAVLEQVVDALESPIDAWACQPPDFLGVGDSTATAEIPGFWVDDPQAVTRTFQVESGGEFFTRSYDERPINLLPPGVGVPGQLKPTEGMTPSEAFYAAAMEPGAVRWRPLWRYGTITAKTGNLCSLTLETREAREMRTVNEGFTLDTTEQRSLVDVTISYPPCNGGAFLVGDEVLVMFEGQDRDKPKVIGFKFGPRVCPTGRVSWR